MLNDFLRRLHILRGSHNRRSSAMSSVSLDSDGQSIHSDSQSSMDMFFQDTQAGDPSSQFSTVSIENSQNLAFSLSEAVMATQEQEDEEVDDEDDDQDEEEDEPSVFSSQESEYDEEGYHDEEDEDDDSIDSDEESIPTQASSTKDFRDLPDSQEFYPDAAKANMQAAQRSSIQSSESKKKPSKKNRDFPVYSSESGDEEEPEISFIHRRRRRDEETGTLNFVRNRLRAIEGKADSGHEQISRLMQEFQKQKSALDQGFEKLTSKIDVKETDITALIVKFKETVTALDRHKNSVMNSDEISEQQKAAAVQEELQMQVNQKFQLLSKQIDMLSNVVDSKHLCQCPQATVVRHEVALQADISDRQPDLYSRAVQTEDLSDYEAETEEEVEEIDDEDGEESRCSDSERDWDTQVDHSLERQGTDEETIVDEKEESFGLAHELAQEPESEEDMPVSPRRGDISWLEDSVDALLETSDSPIKKKVKVVERQHDLDWIEDIPSRSGVDIQSEDVSDSSSDSWF